MILISEAHKHEVRARKEILTCLLRLSCRGFLSEHYKDEMGILLLAAAIVLPPLAVYLVSGLSFQVVIASVLTLAGYIPGILYALWTVLRS